MRLAGARAFLSLVSVTTAAGASKQEAGEEGDHPKRSHLRVRCSSPPAAAEDDRSDGAAAGGKGGSRGSRRWEEREQSASPTSTLHRTASVSTTVSLAESAAALSAPAVAAAAPPPPPAAAAAAAAAAAGKAAAIAAAAGGADVLEEVEVAAGEASTGEQPALLLHRRSCALVRREAGRKLRPEQVPRPPPNTALQEAVALATMLLLFGFMWLGPWALLGTLYCALVLRSGVAAAALAVAITLAVAPRPPISHAFRHHWVWDTWRRYFRLTAITPPLPWMDLERHYLCAQFPHGCFPMGCLLNPPLVGLPASGMPGPMEGVVASVLLWIPVVRTLFAWLGTWPADRQTLLALLRRCSVGMQPEGIAGIFEGASPAQEAVYLSQRKGFVRLAIQAGAGIVPVYHFGNSRVLTFRGWKWASRKLRLSVGLFWGRWGLPLPRKQWILSVAAPPIEVTQCDAPSQEYVDEVHARLIAALQGIFEENKHLVPGMEQQQLHIA